MKQTFTLIFVLAAVLTYSQSGVGIGTATPNPAAALDITATGKGFLIPRTDSVTRVAIANPPDGLMVFQSDGRKGFWYAVGGSWLYIPDKTSSGDNLGNHTATQALNLKENLIVGSDGVNGTGTTGIRVDGAGYVGINTSTPSQKLDVNGAAKAARLISTGGVSFGESTTADGTLSTSMRLGGSAAGEGIAWKSTAGGNQYGLDLVTAGQSRLSISNSGRIGIGTTNPTTAAQLTNTSANTIGSDGQGGNAGSLAWAATQNGYVSMVYNGQNSSSSAGGMAVKVASSTSTAFDVSRGTQTVAGAPLFTVKSSGNVGIATNAPAEALDVNGNIQYSGNLMMGVQYVTSGVVVVPAANIVTYILGCPVGTRLIGGGAGQEDGNKYDFHLLFSGPDPNDNSNAWKAVATNINSTSVDFKVYAICAKVQ